MNPDINFTLDITGILALASLVWGFLKMAAKLDNVVGGLTEVREGLRDIGQQLADIVHDLAEHQERLGILEERSGRRR